MIHVHFEYQEKGKYEIFEGWITPTPSDILEFLGIKLTEKNEKDSVKKVLQEVIDNDLLDETNEQFEDFIKEKYYEIKRKEE